ADFSVRFCDLMTDATLDADLFAGRLDNLLGGYHANYRLTPDSVLEALGAAVFRCGEFDRSFSLERPPTAALRMAAARASRENPPADLEIAYIAARHRAAERKLARARLILESKRKDFEILDDAVSSAEVMPHGSPEIAASLATAVARAMNLDAVIVLRASGEGFATAALAGEASSSLRMAALQVDARARDVFGVALSRREDVLISNVSRGNIARYLPLWLKLNAPVLSLILLPVVDSGAVAGLLFGLRSRGRPLETSARTLASLRAVRASLLRSWKAPEPKEVTPNAPDSPEWLPPRVSDERGQPPE
ncbi:MAG TPA: hypothetical protein PKI32_10090, partial [Opitutales bacterium]|nr:hypothetical protein [Opitutales bacterium]